MVKKLLHNDYLFLILRIFLGGLFILSGYSKLSAPVEEFLAQVQQYEFLPGFFALFFAHLLPWVELIAGVLLVLGLWIRLQVVIIGLMIISFLIAIGSAYLRGIVIEDCGCFGSFSLGETMSEVFFRDVGLLLIVIYLFYNRSRRWTLDSYLLKG